MRQIIRLIFFPVALSHARLAQPALKGDLKAGEAGFALGLQGTSWKYHCGAALVSVANMQVGITSARCITKRNMSVVAFDVTVGQEKLFRRVNKIVIHPSQIALLFFIPFEIDETIYPATLPEQSKTLPEGNLTLFQFIDNIHAQKLVHASKQHVVNNSFCSEKFDHAKDAFCANERFWVGQDRTFRWSCFE